MHAKSVCLTAAVLFLACTRAGLDISGTTTETNTSTSAALQGYISRSDGTPVFNADVILHDQQQDTVTTPGNSQASIHSARTKSNSNGFFRFDSLAIGDYVIESNDHDTLGFLLGASVKPGDTLIEADGIVEPLGSIEGSVDTADFLHPGNVTIRLPQIERVVRANNAGSFVLDKLPAWNYVLRGSVDDTLISLVTDTIPIPVTPGTVTHVNIRSKKGKILN